MSDAKVLAYNVEDACRVIGIKKSSLYTLIKDGKIDGRRLGGRTVILAASLQRFLESLPPAPISPSS